MPLGSRYGDIEQPPLFFQILVGNERVNRWELSVHDPNDKHTLPLKPLGGMDRGQYESFVIAIGRLDARCAPVRRLQREVGQKSFDPLVPLRDRLQMIQISRALGIV